MDKRQGHGQVKFADTSIYDGQFRNDLFNGEGTMYHCSGFVYEGLWINGEPAQLATKIVLVGTEEGNTIEITQGETFALQIECRTDEGEVVEDQGRELQVIASRCEVPASQGKHSIWNQHSRNSGRDGRGHCAHSIWI
ncbi:MORN repeat-containing protein 1-like isoform X3 [Lingula anatina]|uniref:MORN repeat-containing protein 1-like isoform X2 n=1 Tax=Lingula anatina TaxID=7574 RepID=A0A1S3IQT6_LINAN|nr:MORN repeat-containing protein 1-like isoform X2 [Lingula anatina]XP_013400281.1 MORN repeat-containing protein 1-like isoform X3 [Lingula anatina]|eukprot:XP_013400280.1 MORN repeat-containing protein 1-like isoform X2 [Lingula anatina]